ncbi:hypothetical protein LZ554_001123 [Drepanopeziza brunnea f. sp. 'monogermtubi']|nr:hypothetical protein LZ554_001123 [Drepanopeziza brunnea f. sp. 'monogermtubi']
MDEQKESINSLKLRMDELQDSMILHFETLKSGLAVAVHRRVRPETFDSLRKIFMAAEGIPEDYLPAAEDKRILRIYDVNSGTGKIESRTDFCNEWALSMTSIDLVVDLDAVRGLVDRYRDSIGYIQPIFTDAEIQALIDEALPRGFETNAIEWSQLLLMSALGEVCSRETRLPDPLLNMPSTMTVSREDIVPGLAFFELGKTNTSDEKSIGHGRVHLLASLYLAQLGRPRESRMALGRACACAEMLIHWYSTSCLLPLVPTYLL